MSFVSGELLIEYVLRVAADDLICDPDIFRHMIFSDPCVAIGRDLSAEGASEPVTENLVMDKFQKRLQEIPQRESESGFLVTPFKNSIVPIHDIIKYLKQGNVAIVHGFPRSGENLPCLSITLGNEDEEEVTGSHKGTIQTPKGLYELLGSDFSTQYNIAILTPNYDETWLWYYVLKYAFVAYREIFEAYGLRQTKMSWQDIEPAPDYLQSGLFVYQRTCILSGVKDESIPIKVDGYDTLSFGIKTSGGVLPGGQITPEE